MYGAHSFSFVRLHTSVLAVVPACRAETGRTAGTRGSARSSRRANRRQFFRRSVYYFGADPLLPPRASAPGIAKLSRHEPLQTEKELFDQSSSGNGKTLRFGKSAWKSIGVSTRRESLQGPLSFLLRQNRRKHPLGVVLNIHDFEACSPELLPGCGL